MDIVNSPYATRERALVYKGDVQYALFRGADQLLQDAVMALAPPDDEDVRRATKLLGIVEGSQPTYDTYYSQIIDYSWHDADAEHGAHFTPIYHRISEARAAYPSHAAEWQVLRRRLVAIQVAVKDIEFVCQRYDPTAIPKLFDIIVNKVESLASRIAETVLLALIQRARMLSADTNLDFKDVVDELHSMGGVFTSINTSLDGLLLVKYRNHVVHAASSPWILEGHNVLLDFPVRVAYPKFGVLENYLGEDVATSKTAHSVDRKVIDGQDWHVMVDPRFQDVSYVMRKQKNGKLSLQDVELRFTMPLSHFLKKQTGFLFMVLQGVMSSVMTNATAVETGPDGTSNPE